MKFVKFNPGIFAVLAAFIVVPNILFATNEKSVAFGDIKHTIRLDRDALGQIQDKTLFHQESGITFYSIRDPKDYELVFNKKAPKKFDWINHQMILVETGKKRIPFKNLTVNSVKLVFQPGFRFVLEINVTENEVQLVGKSSNTPSLIHAYFGHLIQSSKLPNFSDIDIIVQKNTTIVSRLEHFKDAYTGYDE